MEEKPAGRTRLSVALAFTAIVALVATTTVALVAADPAGAARYTVSECGWYVSHDATWQETSSAKFIRSSYCQPPRTADAFADVHLTSETRNGSNSVGGTKFARWRWAAPDGVTITNIHGHRWQAVNDGFEHRLGGVTSSGFTPFMGLATTDTSRRDFKQNLPSGTTAFESRLLCARAAEKRCGTTKKSTAGVRALTFTMEDPLAPTVTTSGGLLSDTWLRGGQTLDWTGSDRGAGLRSAETTIDGSIRARTQHSCSTVNVGGLTRGSRMRPCPLTASGKHVINTASLNDGPHSLRHCAVDFAAASGCTGSHTIRTDNTAPGAPRELEVVGGDGWRQTNRFDLTWVAPDQGVAAPITVSRLRITEPGGRESDPISGTGTGEAKGLSVTGPGEHRVRVWLIDAAGNEREEAAAKAVLRFDDVPPAGYFRNSTPDRPELLRVPVSDQHSGIAGGAIAVRNLKSDSWRDLPTGLAGEAGKRELTARMPSEEFGSGMWVARATFADLAGNQTVTSRRGDGSTVVLRTPLKAASSLTAKLVGKRTSGPMVRVGYGSRASLVGRLAAAGQGLAGSRIRVTEQPRAGSRRKATSRLVMVGADGRFRVRLAGGTSRRVTVSFPGSDNIAASSAGPFALKVRAGITFRAQPKTLRNGRLVRFRGMVRAKGARRPVTGNVIAIQYLERSSGHWRPVLMTRTDRNGNYRASYRFRYIIGSARIRLRAVMPASPWFPFERAISRRLTVKVRG